jgi:type I restriction enzyme, S subunit
LQRGKDLTQADFKKGDIPVAGSNGIIGYHDKANVKGPGVTVGRSGSVGKVVYYESDFWAHNTALYVKDFHGNDPRFVSYYLQALNLARFKSGASVPTLDRNQFRLMPILIPEQSEQMAIARTLVTIERNIAFTLSRKNTYEDLFRTLLHELMTAKIRVET